MPSDSTLNAPTAPTAATAPTVRRRLLTALAAAAATAVAAHLANLLAFFIGNQLAPTSIPQVNAYFLLSSVLAFVVVLVLAAAGLLARAWTAAIAGLVAGIVGAVFGTLVQASATGEPITGEVWFSIVQTFGGLNLVFLLAFVIAAATLGHRIAVASTHARSAKSSATAARPERRIALIRQPADDLDAGELTHLERVPVDRVKALQQWEEYVDALEEAGWETVQVTTAPELPDSVFLEDALLVVDGHAVLTRPGAESRRGEVDGAEEAARALDLIVHRIEAPGTLEGGDVLRVGSTVYVGRGGRTNAEGVAQLRALLRPLGLSVVAVPLTRALHLKSAVTALPDGTVIGWESVVDEPRLFPSFLPMPEEGGAHVVVLGPDTLLMAASAPRSAELLRELGYRVVTVDISEFEKLEGCVTCLSVRVR
ncbi:MULTISPECIES: dimethylargininase [unclassified Rathayibacter]|uniref:dimethylargininase n=1 Tax=unclassified Rathayibacter TaxID=2609250 RepID=UPI0010F2F175|nr:MULTISPECIES: dimethylargininase [unclassified Rathayibacter]TCL84842.1 dimethylargininase [Rathayibacter sp. PhB192]TCM30560.1 dimethylargininase [Rathayibacter sp. PhB179]